MHGKMRRITRGFTLVELLVVVAIIALLIALLLPALQKAKYQAKIVVCMSSLRQVGIGLTAYATENGAYYPYVRRYQNGVEVTMRNPTTATGQDMQEWQLMLPYYGGKLSMKRLYTCPMVVADCNALWPADRFPYNGANAMPLVTYQLWYYTPTDNNFVRKTITRLNEQFETGKHVVDAAHWNILVSDVMACRKYGMNYHDATYGNAVNHVPYGEATSGMDSFHFMGMIVPFSVNYNANYLYTDGSAAHRPHLRPLVNLKGTYNFRLPLEDAR